MSNTKLNWVVAALFAVSCIPVEPVEDGGDHHDHPGMADSHASAPGHTHGDSDDHHESSDDDCHHQAVHCCCSHAQTGSIVSVACFDSSFSISRFLLPTVLVAHTPSAAELLHVPIA